MALFSHAEMLCLTKVEIKHFKQFKTGVTLYLQVQAEVLNGVKDTE